MFSKIIAFIIVFYTILNGDSVIQSYTNGSINWSDGTVKAKGLGFSKKQNPIIAYKMAQRAAKLDAMRNLLEIIGKVKINSDTTIGSKILDDDKVKLHISGYIQNILNITYNKLDKNSVEAVVTIKMQNTLSDLIQDTSSTSSSTFTGNKATGLIIDATHLNFVPSLNPKLIQEFSGVLYPDNIFRKDNSKNRFVAIYLKNIEDAKKHPLIGAFPLVIKAKKIYNDKQDQLVINKENSLKIINELKKDALENGQVIIVVK